MENIVFARPAALPVTVVPSVAWAALPLGLPIPPQHQIQDQAELNLTVVPTGIEGTSGFTGKGVAAAMKRREVRGVPPRGRPV